MRRTQHVFWLISAAVFSALLPLSSVASAPTFGMEFNFTNLKLHRARFKRWNRSPRPANCNDPGPEEQEAATRFSEEVKKLCGNSCTITPKIGKFQLIEYEVRFTADGWGFNITSDPEVVEIQTLPETSPQIRKNLERYRTYVFEAAIAADLRSRHPSPKVELSAHLNVGFLSAFDDDPKEFLRFFLDYADRPALALGILGHDVLNAPPVSMLSDERKHVLATIVKRVNNKQFSTASDVAVAINQLVYTESPGFKNQSETVARHYQAFGLKQLLRPEFGSVDLPFELRAIRQPTSPEGYALVAELMELRMSYLKKKVGEPIIYQPRSVTEFEQTVYGQGAQFYAYMTQMEAHWEDYRLLLPKRLITALEEGSIQKAFSPQRNLRSRNQRLIWENLIDPARNRPKTKAVPSIGICGGIANGV